MNIFEELFGTVGFGWQRYLSDCNDGQELEFPQSGHISLGTIILKW